jgi:transcriptional regulator with XRE-family HTH domain
MFSKNFKRLRELAGLTQAAFAERMGVPLRTVQNWEQGHREPRLETFPAIAEALGVTPDRLIATGDEPPGEVIDLDGTGECMRLVDALAAQLHLSREEVVEIALRHLAAEKLPARETSSTRRGASKGQPAPRQHAESEAESRSARRVKRKKKAATSKQGN